MTIYCWFASYFFLHFVGRLGSFTFWKQNKIYKITKYKLVHWCNRGGAPSASVGSSEVVFIRPVWEDVCGFTHHIWRRSWWWCQSHSACTGLPAESSSSLPCYGSEVVADHCSWCTEPHTERREREREYRQKGQLKSLNETELSVADTSRVQN